MAGFRKLRLMKVAPSANRRVAVCVLIYAFFSLFPLTTIALPASAKVLISVDKSTQHMSVSVDGVSRYRFAVSTGRAGYGTPNGTYHPERLAASWFSKLYYNSPMPHSIFFTVGMQSTEAMRSTDSVDLPHMAASVFIRRMLRLSLIW
jgi:lipoprotein-anchoring transpeptidase ErfK/SrfK